MPTKYSLPPENEKDVLTGGHDEFKKHLKWQKRLKSIVTRGVVHSQPGEDALSTPVGKWQLALCVLGLVCALPSFSPYIVLFVPHIEEALSLTSTTASTSRRCRSGSQALTSSFLSPTSWQVEPCGVRSVPSLARCRRCARSGQVQEMVGCSQRRHGCQG